MSVQIIANNEIFMIDESMAKHSEYINDLLGEDFRENEVKEDEVKEDEVKEDEVKEDEVKEDEVKEDEVKEYINVVIDKKFNHDIVKYVIEFLKHETTDGYEKVSTVKSVLKNRDIYDHVPRWYGDFANRFTFEEAIDICNLADFLHIENLVELCSIYIAILVIDRHEA
jgi:hypothetical protein